MTHALKNSALWQSFVKFPLIYFRTQTLKLKLPIHVSANAFKDKGSNISLTNSFFFFEKPALQTVGPTLGCKSDVIG